MTHKEAYRERKRGALWFRSLSSEAKLDAADAFVLGTFEWRDFFERKPSAAFLNGADAERIYLETIG